MKKLFYLVWISFCCTHLAAEETNRLFVSVDESNCKMPDDISRTNEYLPAEQFPAGNWGKATNGIQVSLRFDNASYTNGEPIQTMILVRNVSNEPAFYHSIYVSGFDGIVRFITTTEDDRKFEGVDWEWGARVVGRGLRPGCQMRFVERFDKEYHLTNGTFFVKAYVTVGPGRTYAESAKVPVKIER